MSVVVPFKRKPSLNDRIQERFQQQHRERLGPMVPYDPDGEAQFIASMGMVLRARSGSEVSGVALPGPSDHDEMGICLESADTLLGLHHFDQYEYRTAGGKENGSRPGDLDLTVYSLRKFLRLAMGGNPNLLNMFFAPPEHVLFELTVDYQSQPYNLAEELRTLVGPWAISEQVSKPFIGYLLSQRKALLGERAGAGGKRREALVEAHGFDTKFAAHMVRLGVQGEELLRTGRMSLPLPREDREWCVALRKGEHTMQEALDRADDLLAKIRHLEQHPTGALRPTPDRFKVHEWCMDTHMAYLNNWKDQD